MISLRLLYCSAIAELASIVWGYLHALSMKGPLSDALSARVLCLFAGESAELAAQGRRSVTLLEAMNSAAPGPQCSAQCELMCSCDGRHLWRDRLSSPAVQLAGSRQFAAVALTDGTLQACPCTVLLLENCLICSLCDTSFPFAAWTCGCTHCTSSPGTPLNPRQSNVWIASGPSCLRSAAGEFC